MQAIIAFCRADGDLVEVVRDDFQVVATRTLPAAFAEVLDTADIGKAEALLSSSYDARAVFDWPINVRLGERPAPLRFAAARAGQRLLVVAAATRMDLALVLAELLAGDPPLGDDLRAPIGAIVNQALKQRVQQQSLELEQAHAQLHHEIEDRSQAKQELAADEQRYRTACHGGLGSFCLLDCVRGSDGQIVDFRVRDVNRRGAEMVALTRKQMIGQNLCELLPNIRTDGSLEKYINVVKSGEPLDEELELNTPRFQGWLHRQVIPLTDGVAIFSRNITNRKLAEKALRESEEKWCSLIENVPDYISIVDRDGRLLFMNRADPAHTVEQVVGRPIYEFLGADQHGTVREALRDVFDLRKGVRYEIQSLDGKCYSHHAAPLRADGEVTAAIVISRDITERKRLAQIVQTSDDNFRLIAETMQDVIWMRTPGADKLDYVSPAYEKIWGRSRVNLRVPPMLFLEAVHPEDRERIRTVAEQHAAGQWNDEYRIVRPDGSIRWIRDRSFQVRDISGRQKLLAGIATDITDLKIAERTARQAERLASLGTLAAGIAHEINNPISAAWTAAEVAQAITNKPNAVVTLDECLSTIVDAVKRCDQIVQNVLQLARDDPSAKSPHNINDVVRRACQAAAVPSKLPGVDVQLELDEHLTEATVNALDIERAVINLVHNAVEASTPGGVVTVCTVGCPRAVRIVVQDHGRGMSEPERQHIFDPFYTNRRDGSGTGMGLPLVHKIVQEHSGTITVHSQLGAGSTFTIDLPQAKSQTSATDGGKRTLWV